MKTASHPVTIEGSDLVAFLASWPCHGIDQRVRRVEFWFDHIGDLVDVNATDATGDWIDLDHDAAGAALNALASDAKAKLTRPQKKAEPVHPLVQEFGRALAAAKPARTARLKKGRG
jgi:hypothetical protein